MASDDLTAHQSLDEAARALVQAVSTPRRSGAAKALRSSLQRRGHGSSKSHWPGIRLEGW